jgi:hypothetical protein
MGTMWDYLRNLRKTAVEKRQEAITAYLSEAMSPQERRRFEAEMAQDAELRTAVAQQRTVMLALRNLPARRTPRNFTLDPAKVSAPQRQPLVQAYPVLRAATALTAVLFIFALVAGFYTQGAAPSIMGIAMELEEVQVTRVITEYQYVEGSPIAAAPEMEEPMQEEAIAEEESASDAAAPDAATFDAAEGAAASEAPPVETSEEAEAPAAAQAPEEEAGGQIAPLPTPTMAATQAPLPTITASTSPRITATAVPDRVAPLATAALAAGTTAVTSDETANGVADEGAVETAVESAPVDNSIWLVGLFGLLLILATLTWAAHRQLTRI